MSSPLNVFGQILAQIANQGGQSLSNAMQAQGNPLAFQQQQENQRQAAQLAQQLNMHNTMTPYESAQVGLQAQSQHEQAGRDVWNAINQGATFAPTGASPDFVLGGRGMMMPNPDAGYTIPANSDMGKFYKLDRDVTVKPEQYLDAHIKYQGIQSAEQDDVASKAVLDVQKQNARSWLLQRFSPGFSQTMYGRSDPTATMESQNLAGEIETAQTSKDLSTIMDRARNYRTPWEQHEDKKMDLKNQLDIRAAQNTGDPHLQSAYQYHNREFDELEKPIQKDWEEGQIILGIANARNPQADATLIPALSPYITGVKRFSSAELANMQGGATAWTKLQTYMNQYASNPNAARFTDVQRQQIISLISQKLNTLKGSLDKINDAREQLGDAETTPQAHKIAAKLHRDLSTLSPEDSILQKYGFNK